jgi:hypothetical protein
VRSAIDTDTLPSHLSTPSDTKQYWCRICEREFTHGAAFAQHKRAHAAEMCVNQSPTPLPTKQHLLARSFAVPRLCSSTTFLPSSRFK